MRPSSGYKEQAKTAVRYSDMWTDFNQATRHQVIFLMEEEEAKSLNNNNDGSDCC
jgi:hypothetical protein